MRVNIHSGVDIATLDLQGPVRALYHAGMTLTEPRINLSALLRAPGDASIRGETPNLRYEQGGELQTLTFAVPAPFRVDVNTLQGNEFYLQGRFQPTLMMECARCLRPVEVPLDVPLGTLMRYAPSVEEPYLEEADTGEEMLVFGHPDLDLSAYLAETTLLVAPLSVLHDEACKGLCQVCGTDLNESTCAHQARVPVEALQSDMDGDPNVPHATSHPFAALRDLDLPDE